MKKAIFVLAAVVTLASCGSASQKECTDCAVDSTVVDSTIVDTVPVVDDTVHAFGGGRSRDFQTAK